MFQTGWFNNQLGLCQAQRWQVVIETPLQLFCRPEHRARLGVSVWVVSE